MDSITEIIGVGVVAVGAIVGLFFLGILLSIAGFFVAWNIYNWLFSWMGIKISAEFIFLGICILVAGARSGVNYQHK